MFDRGGGNYCHHALPEGKGLLSLHLQVEDLIPTVDAFSLGVQDFNLGAGIIVYLLLYPVAYRMLSLLGLYWVMW